MKRLFQRSNRIYCLTNICVCLLCSSYLYTGYCNENNDVQQELSGTAVEKDLEPLSEQNEEKVEKVEENKVEVVENKVTTNNSTTQKKTNTTKKVVTSTKTTTSSKKYVKPKYDSVTGSAVVDYAKKYLGLRYVSGGNSLTTGTDCSGFTKLIYKEFGITLSRSVKSQVKNGTYVKKSDLQKGDLVFYGKRKGVVSHVAIYIGNGKVIHQSTPKKGVKIDTVNMMVYITARRVISKPASTSPTNKDNSSTNNNSNVNNSLENNNQSMTNNNVNNNVENNNQTTTNNNVNNNTENNNQTTTNNNVNNNTESNNQTTTNNNVNNNTESNNQATTDNNVNNNTENNNQATTNNSVNNNTNDSSVNTNN